MIVPIPILPGMRQDVDARAGGVPPGTLRYAQNVRFAEAGAVERRRGTVVVPPAGLAQGIDSINHPEAAPDFASQLGDALVVGAGGVACGFHREHWRYLGRYGSALPIGSRQVFYVNGSIAHSSPPVPGVACSYRGYTLYVLQSSDYLDYIYRDPSGNLIDEGRIEDVVKSVVFRAGSNLYLIVEEKTTAEIKFWRFGGDNPGTEWRLDPVFTLEAQGDGWDATPWDGGSLTPNWALIVYNSDDNRLEYRRYNDRVQEANAVNQSMDGGVTTVLVSAYAQGDWLWGGYTTYDGSGDFEIEVSTLRWRSDSSSWAGSGFVALSLGSGSGSAAVASAPQIGPGPTPDSVRALIGRFGLDLCTTSARVIYLDETIDSHPDVTHVRPTSKPFGPRGEWFWGDIASITGTTSGGAIQPTRRVLLRTIQPRDVDPSDCPFIIDLVSLAPTAQPSISFVGFGGLVSRTPSGTYIAPIAHRYDAGGQSVDYASFVEFELAGPRQIAPCAGAIVVAGQPCDVMQPAQPSNASGFQPGGTELGFAVAPTIYSTSSSNSTGSLSPNTTYYFVAVYKWVDGLGRVHRSAPSNPASVTTGGSDDTITVRVFTCAAHRKSLGNDITVELYRLLVGGTTWYLCAPEGLSVQTLVTFTVTDDDSAIADNAILYTDGGVVADSIAPAARFVVASEERVFLGGLWDPTLVVCSKIVVPEEPPRFTEHDAFRIRFPEPLTGMAFLDGTLYAFSARNVYAMPTDGGPNDQGVGQFATPRLIAAGAGCINERSVVATPIGVFYQSPRGLELIPRGGATPVFIGAGIEDELKERSEILSAAVHEDHQVRAVRFVCRSPEEHSIEVLTAEVQQGVQFDAGDPVTFQHTLSAGENRLVLVMVGYNPSGGTVSDITVTYGGTEMTLVGSSASSTASVNIFALDEEDLPSAGDYEVSITIDGTSFGSNRQLHAIAVELTGARGVEYIRSVTATDSSDDIFAEIDTLYPNSVIVDAASLSLTNANIGTATGQTAIAITNYALMRLVSSHRSAPEPGPYGMGWRYGISTAWHQVAIEVPPVEGETRVLVYDIDRGAWSVDTYPMNIALTAPTKEGKAFLLSSPMSDLHLQGERLPYPNLLLESDDTLGDGWLDNTEKFFESRLKLHTIYPFDTNGIGLFGEGSIRYVVAVVAAQAQGVTLNIAFGKDEEPPREQAFPIVTSGSREYRYLTPLDSARATSAELEAWDSSSGLAGLTWYGFALDVDSEGVPRRRREGESA